MISNSELQEVHHEKVGKYIYDAYMPEDLAERRVLEEMADMFDMDIGELRSILKGKI